MVGVVALLVIAGAALLYGDGMITPAISVLSAVEGLEVAAPWLKPAVLPITCLILVLLFAFQHRGTGRLGQVFGPIMVVWFVVIGALGAVQIAHHPAVLAALGPQHAARYFASARRPQPLRVGLGGPGGHRRRGALCRHGTLRTGGRSASAGSRWSCRRWCSTTWARGR